MLTNEPGWRYLPQAPDRCYYASDEGGGWWVLDPRHPRRGPLPLKWALALAGAPTTTEPMNQEDPSCR